MKIAYFTDTYHPQPNGVATSVGYFANGIRKKGNSVFIFAPKIRGYKDKEDFVYRIPSVRAPTLPDSIRIPLPIPHSTFAKIFSFEFDIIHAHGNGLFSLLGLAIARAKKIPYVQTYHTQMSNYSHYFLNGTILKPKHINSFFLKYIGNVCDGIITPSDKMRQELVNAGVTKEIEVIPNFVDYKKFKIKDKNNYLHKKLNIPEKSLILLSVGRLGKEKNFEFLLQVFSEIIKFDKNVHLVLVGEGKDSRKLKSVARNLKLKGRFHMTGGIPMDQMPKVYGDGDIFILPSITEVHPMVAIEAAASGLPLIAANDAAYKGIVIEGRNGFMLPVNKKLFMEKIVMLLNNKTLLKKLGKESVKICEENFSDELLVKKELVFYEKIIYQFRKTH